MDYSGGTGILEERLFRACPEWKAGILLVDSSPKFLRVALEKFREDEASYLNRYRITPEQKQAVLDRDWLELLRLGGNIYYTFKIAAYDGLTMQHVGAGMSGTGMTVEEFQQMMLDGGRSVAGNLSKQEQQHG